VSFLTSLKERPLYHRSISDHTKINIMKQILLVVFISVLIAAKAQGPTLTSSSAPQIGDLYTMQAVYVEGASPGSSGANQVWDYSSIIDSGTTFSESVVSPSGTPYAASFPGANIALSNNSGDTAYGYETLSNNSLTYLGNYISAAGFINYNVPRVLFQYPLSYTDSYTNPFAGTTFNGDSITGTDSIVADGYGTLRLPSHTYSNVLRLRYTQYTHTINSSLGYYEDLYQVEYSYYIPGYHNFLLDIAYTTNDVNGAVSSGTGATYAKGVTTGISDINPEPDIKVYPTLTSGIVTVQTANTTHDMKYELYGLDGSVQMHGNLSEGGTIINLKNITASIYILRIIGDNSSTVYKVVKQ
jgi:hypothetical protein